MAASVSITITVDASQSGQAISDLTAKMNDLGVKGDLAMKKIGNAMSSGGAGAPGLRWSQPFTDVSNAMNSVGAPALRWSNAMQEVKGHSASSLDSVRLLSQEFGLRLPRAMEAMLSRVPAVTSALSSVLSGVVAIAAIEVFVRVAQEAVEFYNKLFDVNAAMREYLGNAGKAASQKLFDEASLETSLGLLKEANSQVAQLEAKRVQAGADKRGGGFLQYLGQGLAGMAQPDTDVAAAQLIPGREPTIYSKADGQRQAKAAADAALAQARSQQLQQEQAMQQLKDRLAAQAEAAPAGSRAAIERRNARQISERERADQLAKEQAQQRIEQTARAQQLAYGMKEDDPKLTQVHQIDPNAGKEEQRIKDLKADEDYQAKATVLGRETALALMKADDERVQASLSDEALLQRKRLDDIRELTLQYRNEGKAQEETAARIAAINAKYAGDESERLVKRQNETAEAAKRTRLGGLKDFARADAEHDLQVGKNNADPEMVRNGTSGAANLAAQQEFDQKRKELDDNFQAAAKQSIEQHTADQMGAFAKIEAEAQKEITEKQKAYDAAYQDASGHDTATLQQQKTLADNIAAIKGDAANKETELRQRNAAEDLQFDQQAAAAERRVKEDGMMGWVAAYKNGIVEIQAQEAERIAKLQADAAKEGLTAEEVARRKADIAREANAEIAQQNQQLQHQIAGNLQAAFTDPIAFIKSRMEQMFFEIVAAWIMRMQVFKTLFGNTMGGLQPGAPGAGGAAQTGSAGGGMLGQAIHAATGLAMPRSAPGGTVPSSASPSSSPIAGMPGTTGYVNGHPDLSKIYENIPAAAPPTGSNGGFGGSNPPVVGDGDDMIAQQAASSSSLSAAGQTAGVAMAGYAAEQTTVKAFETGNPLTGALGDAAAGATIGSLAGPEGALIGAAIGAGVGAAAGTLGYATGEAGNLGARAYYRQSVKPQLIADEQQQGGGDFQTQISNANKTAADGLAYMRVHFGKSSADWVYSHYLEKDLHRVTAEIAAAAMGGRFAVTSSAAQFHTGGDITGFGSFHTSPTEGFIHAMMGETVMNRRAAGEHGPLLRALNAGASATDIASAYLAGSPRGNSGGATYNGGDIHVHTLDTKTMSGWLRNGGAQLIKKHTNDFSAQYAGDGVNG